MTGQVRLSGAHIGGQLACEEATLTKPDGDTLAADGLIVVDNVYIDGIPAAPPNS